ncbi:hypothetical protein I532_03995 [Brevibacillus borstelensis AK1]|uniref:Uncharacterized protein n=1 Tax=Brevibacillus borstelensis AK1 TaxID=1300222 RepID=M8DMN4_9BACL|nr:hypothetical protein I532_03995 [Brevibacillus borstelensis AK1]
MFDRLINSDMSDHVVALKMGEYLSRIPQIDRSSQEELLVAYYERCVKHIDRQVSLTNASEILCRIEREYLSSIH